MKNNKGNTVSKLLGASVLFLLGAAPLSAQACGPDSYLGEICVFAFDYCPEGTAKADGSLLNIQQYTALYSLLGIRFGGDGRTTFGVPDLRGKVPLGTGTSDYGTITQLGQKGGSASFNLSASNLPQHTHAGSTAQLAAGSVIDGPLSLPVSGGTVSGQTISGSVTVNALNGGNPPSSGTNIPNATANTVGKVGTGLNAFYPSSNAVAVPSSHNLTVSGGSISGANASGNTKLPANATNLAVTVGPNSNVTSTAIPTVPPFVGLTACITTMGTYPMRPN